MSTTTDWTRARVGTRVMLHGLQGRPDLNGRVGRVIQRFDKKTGRVGVRVVSNLVSGAKGEGVNLKPINLVEDPASKNVLDGFEVVDSGDATLGRVAVATRDYSGAEAASMVLVEPPTLMFDPAKGYTGMMDAYLTTSSASKQEIMDMFRPSEAADSSANGQQTRTRLQHLEMEWDQYCRRKPEAKRKLPLQDAKKLMRVLDANAHSLSMQDNTGSLVATHSTLPKDFMALFAKGSKVEHSCAPNLTYTTEGGKLHYGASRSIKKGDRISISYQTASLEQPRAKRREFLQINKYFTCHCERCMGPDECNPYIVSCLICKKSDAVAFYHGDETNVRCASCQSTIFDSAGISSQKEIHAKYEQRLHQVEHNLQSGYPLMQQGERAITNMVKLQHELADSIPPLHWMHVKWCRLMSSMAASFARMYMQQGQRPTSAKVKRLLYLSTLSLLRQASWVVQTAAVVYHDVPLKEAITSPANTPKISEKPSLQDIEATLGDLCRHQQKVPFVEAAHPIFHAGQDWLLAGDAPSVAHFYQNFLELFQSWTSLSDENRERIATLVESQGTENPFPNHLM